MRRRLRQRAEREQDEDRARDAGDDDALFVASSGSERSRNSSSSETGESADTGTATRRRLRQKLADADDSAGGDDDNDAGMAKAAETIIVLDSDSDDTSATTAAVATAAADTTEWECSKCTYLNETSRSMCEICTSPCPTRKLRNLSQWLAPAGAKRTSRMTKTEKEGEPNAAAKKRKAPPLEVIDSSGGSDLDKSDSKFKAPVRASTPSKQGAAQSNALWADTHSPATVEELCVNKKKIQELSDWLNQSARPLSAAMASSFHARKRLLFLCGPPGSGKSTAVRCIAKQMGLGVKEWDDNTSAGKLSYERMLQDHFYMQQTSGADDFMDFIARSVNYAALPMVPVVTSGRRQERLRKRKLAASQSQVSPLLQQQPQTASQVILIENWPQSWSKPGSAWEDKVQKVFRLIVDPAGKNQFPVVCIFSDVRESKIDMKQLAKLFSPEVMNSPFTTVMNFNSVTAAQLKKQLVRIADLERCSTHPLDIQQVVDKSGGDIRHAINMLQLVVHRSQRRKEQSMSAFASQKTKSSKKKTTKSAGAGAATPTSSKRSEEESTSTHRDAFLSDFHVVGKILHGKMSKKTSSGGGAAEKSHVDFDQMVDVSAMSLEKVLELVHENCVGYFSQVDDLGDAMELLSMSENILAESYKGNSNSEVFKRAREVARAIIVRSIALTNDNPTPTAFRPITGARGFATRQRVAWKKEEMFRFTRGSDAGGLEGPSGSRNFHYLCSGDTFAFDVEPYLALIRSSDAGSMAANTVSAGAVNASGTGGSGVELREEVDDEIESSDGDW